MDRNDFLTITQRNIRTKGLYRLYFLLFSISLVCFLPLVAFLGYFNGKNFIDILLLREQPWWIFYIIIFPLFYVLQQRKIELTIEPLSRIDVNKLEEYFKQKKFVLEYNDEKVVMMRNTPKFDWLFGKDLDIAEIRLEDKLIKLTIAGKRAYDLSHAFRWTKDFLKA